MFFTKNDFDKIAEYLKSHAKKDTDFVKKESVSVNSDILTIVSNGVNYKIHISDLLKSGIPQITIDKLKAVSVEASDIKVTESITVDANNIHLDNDKGTTLQDVLNYFENNKLDRNNSDTFKGDNLTVEHKLDVKEELNIQSGRLNIKEVPVSVKTTSTGNNLVIDSELTVLGDIKDDKGNILNDTTLAAKGWKIELGTPSSPSVRESYYLKDYKGNSYGLINVYKDSSILDIKIGYENANYETPEGQKPYINPGTHEAPNDDRLCILYSLSDGTLNLVKINLSAFLTEAEVDQNRGLGVDASTRKIYLKLADDDVTRAYISFNKNTGELSAAGIENRILLDLGTITDSQDGDSTMWGQYKQHEGTLENSQSNEDSRWGKFKEAEEVRNQLVSDEINRIQTKVDEVNLETIKEAQDAAIQAIADREIEILSKTDATLISTNTEGLEGNNVQANLNDVSNKLTELESETNTKLTELELELHESETQSPALLMDGYYVNKNGTRDYYSPFGIFTPIPVKVGDRVVATIDGYNSAASPISWGATDNTNSDMSVTPLAVYTPTNQYDVTIETDGYLIVCGDKTTTPIVTIYSGVYDFEQIGVNKNDIADLKNRLSIERNVTPPVGKKGYYVNKNGGRSDYNIMAIYGPIQVKKGDKVSVTNMQLLNEVIAAIAWSQSPSVDSDMSCTVLALGISTGDSTTKYEAIIPDDGYIFLSSSKDTTPSLSIAKVGSIQPIVDDVNELSEKVDSIDGALDDNKQLPVVINKSGYFVNTSGKRSDYTPYAIFSPVQVKAGDKIIVGNIKNINSAICPLAFNTDGNTNSDMTSTPMSVFENGRTIYSAVAPQDGYFIISNDKTKMPTVEIAKLLDVHEIKQIGSKLSGKITMLFGDSLTAGSTPGIVAFGRVIANVLGIPYRAFVYDRFDPSPDTNPTDVDIDIPSIINYGKDGTKNQLTTGRVDSVLQRIKNHITADTKVDYVLVECCVNDYTSGTKGTLSGSYTGPFDENTAIGAIEETCRYLSTLGKNIRFGFYIPWQISYVPEDYFNDYIPVFEKWAVPIFDMRKCAGFNMRWCTKHQELYSVPASSYANYDNTATYNLDDKVKYEGFLYKCNADGVTGILPTDETYWTKVSEGSFDGCHLNSLGHYIVAGKIQSFMERL